MADPPAPETRILRRGDRDYPAGLEDLDPPPPEVYVRGTLPGRARAVAIVGSRAASTYGMTLAGAIAADLARLGIVVVSGLARGIDAAAHRGAIEGGGSSVAVLPGGLEAITPVHHRPLAVTLCARGALLTEHAGGGPGPGAFLHRNRLIAALGEVTLVVEAAERSGALSTAAVARRLGRPVLAVPGDVDRPTSRGTNALLGARARVCSSAADVIAALPQGADSGAADSIETRLLGALADGALGAEALAEKARVPIGEAIAALLRLEWAGVAVPLAGQRWRRA
jgi:DNA processing protein